MPPLQRPPRRAAAKAPTPPYPMFQGVCAASLPPRTGGVQIRPPGAGGTAAACEPLASLAGRPLALSYPSDPKER